MLTPVKAIRAYCIGCSGGSRAEVRECLIPDCELYPYRMGKNPNIKRDHLKGIRPGQKANTEPENHSPVQ